jgi:hypothetical protein
MRDLTSRTLGAASLDIMATIHDVPLTVTKLRVLVAAIADHKQLQLDIADRSYTHDNGFQKIVIGSTPADGQLRMHVWLPLKAGTAREHGNIHSHRWAFTSAVLAGTLHFEQFVYSDVGEEVDRYIYDPGMTSYELRQESRLRLERLGSGTRHAGAVYSLSEEALHRTWASDTEHTITIVAQQAPTRAHADVLTRCGTTLATVHEIHAMQPAQLREIFASVLEILSS